MTIHGYHYRYLLIAIASVFGLMVVSLLSLESAAQGSHEHWILSQSIAFAGGWLIAFFGMRVLRPWRWQFMPYGLYLSAIVLLVTVFGVGRSVAGHKSWLSVGPFSFQPSEWAKIAVIVLLSFRLATHTKLRRRPDVVLLESALWVGILVALVLAQRDFGTALLLLSTLVACLCLYAFPKKILLAFVLLSIIAAGVTYTFFLSPYQKTRIHSFLHPEEDSQGSGYQLTQAKITIGSGGWLGKGFERGTHHRLRYLPAHHSDFIFCVWAEEWGFVGAGLLLGLYATLLFALWGLAYRVPYSEGYFLAAFAFWHILVHLTVNLGGVLGLVPLTGVPLPLVSYGGSAILSHFSLLGLVFSQFRAPSRFSGREYIK